MQQEELGPHSNCRHTCWSVVRQFLVVSLDTKQNDYTMEIAVEENNRQSGMLASKSAEIMLTNNEIAAVF